MIFGYLTLATALIISLSAAVYSILGLTAIFAAAFWPIVIMGGSLEFGKIITTLWLHKYWDRAEIQYKVYLCSAVAILMLLTSMGVFGFLSKAHLDQAVPSGDVAAKVQIFDDKIKTQRDNIEAARRALAQMDSAVDQTMSRSTTEQGADKAANLRRSQARERTALQNDISKAQKEITVLQEQRAPVAAENRKIEAEVGPIKYIAALVYGDNPEANTLEKAVRWVIILIVIVFDPLALTLLLAATKSIEWERGINIFAAKKRDQEDAELTPGGDVPVFDDKEEIPLEEPEIEKPAVEELPKRFTGFGGDWMFNRPAPAPAYEPDDGPLTDEQIEQIADAARKELPTGNVISRSELFLPEAAPEQDELVNLAKQVYAAEHPDEDIDAHHEAHAAGEITQLPWHSEDHIESLPISDGERARLKQQMALQADNVPPVPGIVTGFGTAFPTPANRGDLFLRVDTLPTILYKYNGTQWIEVDKTLTDSYAHDAAYIEHLINKIGAGQYDPDLLSDAEREQIALRLKTNL